MTVTRASRPSSRRELEGAFRSEALQSHSWSNSPGYVYASHSHPYDKVLYCVTGSITFHTPDGDVVLRPGDRLELARGTEHSASVGEDGVECIEAAR